MDPNALAGMAFTLVLAALVGGFILLYPISRRLGVLLEEKVRDKKTPLPPAGDELRELRESIHAIETELRTIAERQQFIEQLVASREPDALPRRPQ